MILPFAFVLTSLVGSPGLISPLTAQETLLKPLDPERQFDFWIGEWSVQNRNLVDDGNGKNFVWKDGDVTRARITPVCNGAGLLEEWAGPFHGGFMNGFSLRSYDPESRFWTILLFWTTDGNGSFGRMRGQFRHGRGEFLSTTRGPKRTRYTFSDALPNSVRWDQAVTADFGQSWKTDWVMEFSRTRLAEQTTLDRFFAEDWTQGSLSPQAEARQLDWMQGSWTGFYRAAEGQELEARLRCKSISKDCLLVDILETQMAQGMAWQSTLTVRGFEAGKKTWGAWTMSERDPALRGSTWDPGVPPGHAARPGFASFSRHEPEGEFIQTLERTGEDRMLIQWLMRHPDDSDAVPVATARFQRKKTE